METVDDSWQFNWRNWLKPSYIHTAFQNATSILTWVKVDRAATWERLLPIPNIDPSETDLWNIPNIIQPRYLHRQRPDVEELAKERNQKWATDAKDWFLESKVVIGQKKDQVRRQLEKGLELRRQKEKQYPRVDDLFEIWQKLNHHRTVLELSRLQINPKIYKQAIEKWKYDNEVNDQVKNLTNDKRPIATVESELNQPCRALYWFYLHVSDSIYDFNQHSEGKVKAIQELVGKKSYKSFQQHYNRYINSYDSRVCKANVKRIRQILPLLEEYPKAYGRAEDELNIAIGKPSK